MATNQIKHKVQIRHKKTSENRTSLYLDWHDGTGKRKKEYLGLFHITNPQNPIERQENKDTLVFAELKRGERENQYFKGELEEIMEQKTIKNTSFIPHFEKYVNTYSKKDIKVMKAVLKHFKEFAPPYITAKEITESLCNDFKEYLSQNLSGESPSSYFARFKKMIRQVTRDKVLRINPTQDIRNFKTDNSIEKDVLTIQELQLLASAYCGNEEVKRAFLFCCNTGIRWVDVKLLQWKHIDKNVLEFRQSKTKDNAKDGGKVEITLNDSAMNVLSTATATDKESLVFNLPTHESAVKTLKHWAKRAGVEKHITWHVSRHTFGSLLAYYESDILTISKLLGHSSLKYSSRYIRTSNEMKQKAVNSIPTINF